MGVFETEDGAVRYSIRNDNTGKVTKYPVRILSVHLTCAPNEKNVLCSGVQYHWQDRTRMNDYSTPLRYFVGCIPTVYLLGPWRIKHTCEFIEDISRVTPKEDVLLAHASTLQGNGGFSIWISRRKCMA